MDLNTQKQTKQVRSFCVYTTHTKTSFSSYQRDVMEQGFWEWNLSSETLYSNTQTHTWCHSAGYHFLFSVFCWFSSTTSTPDHMITSTERWIFEIVLRLLRSVLRNERMTGGFIYSKRKGEERTERTCEKRHSSRGMQSFFSTLQQQVSITSSQHWCLHQAPALMSSWGGFNLEGLSNGCTAKYRPSLYKDAACVKNTKTFMSCWESRLLLLFILPITSPPAAQHEPASTAKPHKHAHSLTHTHTRSD